MSILITIDRLRIHANHGVLPQERVVGNDFEVSLKIRYPADSRAIENDCLDGTLNYARAIEIIQHEMAIPSQLLEHVGWRIAMALRAEFTALESVEVTVVKLAPPVPATSLREVSVTVFS